MFAKLLRNRSIYRELKSIRQEMESISNEMDSLLKCPQSLEGNKRLKKLDSEYSQYDSLRSYLEKQIH